MSSLPKPSLIRFEAHGNDQLIAKIKDYHDSLQAVRARVMIGEKVLAELAKSNFLAASTLIKRLAYANVNAALSAELQLVAADYTETAAKRQRLEAECRLLQASDALKFVQREPCFDKVGGWLYGEHLSGLTRFATRLRLLFPRQRIYSIRHMHCWSKRTSLLLAGFGMGAESIIAFPSHYQGIFEPTPLQINNAIDPTFAPVVAFLRYFQPP